MWYAEMVPSPLLAPYIRKYWFLEDNQAEESLTAERILPDGCAELIFHYGEPFKRVKEGLSLIQESAFIFGQLNQFIELLPGKKIGVMGVRFHPAGLSRFISIPAGEITGLAVSLNDLFKNGQQFLYEEISCSANAKEKVLIIEKFLLRQISKHEPSTQISALIGHISHQHGRLPVQELVRYTGKSERQLERIFYEKVGLSPKTFSRILRFHQVFKLLSGVKNLTDLALTAGYYDQAHFVREFKSISGMSPRNYFKQEGMLNSLFTYA